MKLMLAGLLLCLTSLFAGFADDLKQAVPLDPDVTIKKLDNGLTYYIRKNSKPEQRAQLRLVINAGSILETEQQQGLAHFLEHMAFNGTKNFAKQELVNYLESIGMRFGADINAYTSFDETVYMLEMPTDDQELLDKAFQILEDWAHLVTIDPEEVDKERGVVVEEWRRGRGAQMRVMLEQMPVLFKGSRYAERLPIGKVDVIENAPTEELVKFYRDWYRPDLMAVVAVGDFDVAAVEKKIIDHFSKLKNPKKKRERKTYDVPGHAETLYLASTDPELTNASLRIEYKRKAEPTKTLADVRRGLVSALYQEMLNDRLRERLQEANPPYIFASCSDGSIARTSTAFRQFAVVPENGFETGLRALLTEAERVRRHGFTQGELDRKRAEYLRGLESAYKERDKTEHRQIISGYIDHFLEGSPILSPEQSLNLGKALLPNIKLADVNKASDAWITEENRAILLSAPEKEGLVLPTKDQVLAMIKEIAAGDVPAYDDNASDQPLLAEQPKPGTVTAEETFAEVGVTKWTLSNGIDVYLKPTDFKNDEVMLRGVREGGASLVADDDLIPVETATTIMGQSGLGAFDAVQLRKKLAGKLVQVVPFISDAVQGVSAESAPDDLETMFQLVHLYYTAPRFEEAGFHSIKNRWQAIIKNRSSRPETVFRDEVRKVMYQDHPRHQPYTAERLEAMSLEKSRALYQQLFQDVNGAKFYIIGNFDLVAIKPMVTKYLGSLPSRSGKPAWRDNGDRRVAADKTVIVRKGSEPKALVSLSFHGPTKYEYRRQLPLVVLNRVLTIRLREIMREDMGGVYNVSVAGGLAEYPIGSFSNRISFSCNPDNVAALVKAADDEVQRLIKEGFEPSYLQKVLETLHREHEVRVKQNGFWLRVLMAFVDDEIPFTRVLRYEEHLKAIDVAKVQQTAERYYGAGHRFEAVLLPETEAGAETQN